MAVGAILKITLTAIPVIIAYHIRTKFGTAYKRCLSNRFSFFFEYIHRLNNKLIR